MLKPEQNDRYLADVIVKLVVWSKFLWQESRLAQVMACHLTDDKQLPEPMLAQLTDPSIYHQDPMS